MPVKIRGLPDIGRIGVDRLRVIFNVPDIHPAVRVACCELVSVEWVTRYVTNFSLRRIYTYGFLVSAIPPVDFIVRARKEQI